MGSASPNYLSTLPKFEYLEPKTVEEACSLLSKYEGKAKVIAGGTDLLVSMKDRIVAPQCLINLKSIPNLAHIRYSGEGLNIGALTTLYDIESSLLIQERFPLIIQAACELGSPHIRNVATIGGNLCNASPSADTAPSLIGLRAKAKIRGLSGERTIALQDFFIGPGKSALQNDEILVEIQVPNSPINTKGTYLRIPETNAGSIAVVSVAVVVTLDSRGMDIIDAKIVLGAVAPIPTRARKAEDVLMAERIKEELIEKAAQTAAEEAMPISDIRGSSSYRRKVVRVLTNQAIRQVTAPT